MANNAVKKAQIAQKKTNLMFENASIYGCDHAGDHAGDQAGNNQNKLRHHHWL